MPAVRWRGRLLVGVLGVCAGLLAPAAGLASAPSSGFNVDSFSASTDGVISFTASVPGPGTIAVLETAPDRGRAADVAATRRPGPGRFAFGRAHFVFSGATTRLLTVRPNSRGREAVRARHRLQVLVWVTYTPSSGAPQTIRLRWGKTSGSFFGG